MKYFIDTNIIIDLLGQDKKLKEKAVKQLKELALKEDSEFFVNRLVTIESLRTIHFTHKERFREAKEKLQYFRQVDIRPQIYNDAIFFSRFCHSKGIKLKGKCEAIDFLHFITAKYYNLKIISNDGDMLKLESAYIKFLENLNE